MSAQLLSLPPIDSTQIFSSENLPEVRITSVSDFPAPTAISDPGNPYDGVMAHQIDAGFTYVVAVTPPSGAIFLTDPIFIKPAAPNSLARISGMDSTIIYSGTVPLFISSLNNVINVAIGGTGQSLVVVCSNSPVFEFDGIFTLLIEKTSLVCKRIGSLYNALAFIYSGDIARISDGDTNDSPLILDTIASILIQNTSFANVVSLGKISIEITGNFIGPEIQTAISIINCPFSLDSLDSTFFISPLYDTISSNINLEKIFITDGDLFKQGVTDIITSFEDNGGGNTRVITPSDNGLIGGEEIYITGQNGYRNIGYLVSTSPVPTATTFELNDATDTPVPFVLADDGPGTWDSGSLNQKTVGINSKDNGKFPDSKVFASLLLLNNALTTVFTVINPNIIQGVFKTQGNEKIIVFNDGSWAMDDIRPGTIEVVATLVGFKTGSDADYTVKLVKNGNDSDPVLLEWDNRSTITTARTNIVFLGTADYIQDDTFQFWIENNDNTNLVTIETMHAVIKRI